jgi:hypothetical protein
MKKYIITLLVAWLAGGAFAGIVFQEGFESPEVVGDGDAIAEDTDYYNRYEAEQVVVFEEGDWTVQNVDLFEDATGTWRGEAKEGDQYIDLACSVNGYIETTTTLAAGEYQISFWLAGNFFGDNDGEKSVDVFMDLGLDIDPASFSATKTGQSDIVSASDWVFVQSAVFTVSEEQSLTLTFDDTSNDTDPWAGAFIDDIQIEAVPEPATISLLFLASLGLFVSRRFSRF